ncbi:MAG: hypothetical protein ACREU8_04155 [Gammaproteobacteria bacterium]
MMLLDRGYDLVIASPMIKGGRNEEDVCAHANGSFWDWASCRTSLRKGPVIWDVLHGFRAMRRERFFAIGPLDHGLSVDLEMVVRGYRKKLRMIEFRVAEKARLAGTTRVGAFQTGRQLLSYTAHGHKVRFFLVGELGRPSVGC